METPTLFGDTIMGKFFIQYVVPFCILLPVVLWGVRMWFLKIFPNSIKNQKIVRKHAEKLERELRK